MPVPSLTAEALYRRCDPATLPFDSTDELQDITEIPGQERALGALGFGIGIRQPGYNLFALGAHGSGKHTTVREYLERVASATKVPSDLCYVNNFETPHRPLALRLPAGTGARLCNDMAGLIEDLQTAIPTVFESQDYRNRRQAFDEELRQRQESAFEKLQARAKEKSIALIRTPMGLALAPMREGEVTAPDEFQKLPSEERQQVQAYLEALQKELEETIRQFPLWDKERRDRIRDLNREVTMSAVAQGIDALRATYNALPEVVLFLDAVQNDIILNVDAFLTEAGEQPAHIGQKKKGRRNQTGRFRAYQVNVVVDSSELKGAPVIYEDNPTQPNLVGRVEYLSEMGALLTDFNLIKAGALHRANGGYLIVDARNLLLQPFAWESLKRALRSREIVIESVGQMMGLISTASLEPQRVPLDIKVVLVGERQLYYLLCEYDPDFFELFKVAVDFEDDMKRNDGSSLAYGRLLATIVRKEKLLALDRSAVARVIEHGARLAGDAEKLSAHLGSVADVLRESDYWAGRNHRRRITATDVQQAIETQERRSDRLRERSLEAIEQGVVLIDTVGTKVGQVNGLSVISLGSYSFGRPSRITARVRMGKGEVVDIERKVDLGGPIHSKGVMILSGFLSSCYALEHPLSLDASLVFEQSYGGVEGDSASSAELYALLSALAEVPIRQDLAVTGSVNQHGEIQAIGGVNEKIEGFFDLCARQGLSGSQGVVIPASNVRHLMLRHDIVEAVKQGKFSVYAVRTSDEGIEILTGVTAGQRGLDGKFADGSLNRKVEDRLVALAERRRSFGASGAGGGAAL